MKTIYVDVYVTEHGFPGGHFGQTTRGNRQTGKIQYRAELGLDGQISPGKMNGVQHKQAHLIRLYFI